MFVALLVANMGTLITEVSAIKTTSAMFNLPSTPIVIGIVVLSFFFITRGSYKLTQNIMLLASLFFLAYIVSAVKAQPDWGMALSNLIWPHGVDFDATYLRNYFVIGMGVLGTTITPWGQFFISSFAYDKKIEKGKVGLSQVETYWGAFLTDFFSFFMIVATAATLFTHGIELASGEQGNGNQPLPASWLGSCCIGHSQRRVYGLAVSFPRLMPAEFFGVSGSLMIHSRRARRFTYSTSCS
jgi:Mn2+/Fe2+ NRAMP family transporter